MSTFIPAMSSHSTDTSCPSLTGKRVAVVVFSYFPSDPRVYRAATALAGAGAEIDLFCLCKSGEAAKVRVSGVNVTRAKIKKSRAGKLAYVKQYAVFTAAAFLWLTRRSLKRRYDLVHVHNMPDFLIFSALFAKLRGSRVVLDLHDPMPEVFLAKYDLKPGHWLLRVLRGIEKLSIGFADLVLTPNLAFRKLFAARSGPEEKIRIVMNSPLEEVFPLRVPQGVLSRGKNAPFVIMYHGTLVERHGLHVAINALFDLEDDFPGLGFYIYGAETPYLMDTVLPLVRELGLESRVHYLGEQSQAIIADAISRCDLGIIPNLRSVFTEINFPTRIFEYLALGKPVLVPQTPGIGDYFGPENMLFFQWGEAEIPVLVAKGKEVSSRYIPLLEDEEELARNLAAKIRWVFEHPAETRALVEKGQEVYRRYTWQSQREALLRAISSLLAK
jgi:glycosyltransferase involved in cell wall biosynthesis